MYIYHLHVVRKIIVMSPYCPFITLESVTGSEVSLLGSEGGHYIHKLVYKAIAFSV